MNMQVWVKKFPCINPVNSQTFAEGDTLKNQRKLLSISDFCRLPGHTGGGVRKIKCSRVFTEPHSQLKKSLTITLLCRKKLKKEITENSVKNCNYLLSPMKSDRAFLFGCQTGLSFSRN